MGAVLSCWEDCLAPAKLRPETADRGFFAPVDDRGDLLLPSGAPVLLRGLRHAHHLNRQGGEVVRWDATRRRYMVRLKDGEVVSVKGKNLLQAARALLVGLERRPELNNLEVQVVESEAAPPALTGVGGTAGATTSSSALGGAFSTAGEWSENSVDEGTAQTGASGWVYTVVDPKTGQLLSVRAQSLQLPCGVLVRMDGLQTSAERGWNGRVGCILAHEPDGRYVVDVRVPHGTALEEHRVRVKRENVSLL